MNRNYYLYSIFLLMLISFELTAQTPGWIWARKGAGTQFDRGASVATDSKGNVYMYGNFSSPTITFGNIVLNKFAPTNANIYCIFIVKYDSLGNVLWAKTINQQVTSVDIIVDVFDNFIISGGHSDYISFGNGVFLDASSFGTGASFIAKFDSNGEILWASQADGHAGYLDIASDPFGNIFITGYLNTTSHTQIESFYLVNNNSQANILVIKYNPQGVCEWVKNTGGDGPCSRTPWGISCDNRGNVIVCGLFYNSIVEISGAYLNNMGFEDIFIVKYSNDGVLSWAKQVGSNGKEIAYDVKTDESDNIYVTGEYTYGFTVDGHSISGSANRNSFLMKFDSLGVNQWAVNSNSNGPTISTELAIDKKNNLYIPITLNLATSLNFNGQVVNNVGNGDILLAKYNSNGDQQWVKHSFSTSAEWMFDIAVSNDGYLYGTGYYESQLNMDTIPLNSSGSYDVLLAKLNTGCTPYHISQQIVNCGSLVSPSGKYIFSESGIYHDTLIASRGCDSILTIDFVNQQSNSTINPFVCGEYISPSGSQILSVSGNYSDTIMNSLGCDSIINIQLTISNLTTSVTQSSDTLFAVSSFPCSYQWINCDSTFSELINETNNFYIVDANDSYAVISSTAGCLDTSNCLVVANIGLNNNSSLKNSGYVYPNPAINTNEVFIKGIDRKSTYSITNSLGKCIIRNLPLKKDDTIDIQLLSPGSYIIEIQSPSGLAYSFKLFVAE